MNIGIVVEGDSDARAYSQLIRKIRDDADVPYVVPCGGIGTLRGKFVGWLKYFEWHASPSVDKALVIRDSDCSSPVPLEDELREILKQSHFKPGFPVHFHATKCMLETWLLADENAINQVSQQREKNKQVAAVTIDLESHEGAKELFQKQLSRADLLATVQVYQEVASFADVARITARCPHFQQFVEKVRAS